MNKKTLTAACALALLGNAALAQACNTKDRKVVQVMTAEVGAYDENGNYVSDIKKEEIPLNQNILSCKDSPAIVQVSLTPDAKGSKRNAWVNLLEVKVSGDSGVHNAQPCKKESVSHLADTTAPATSGIDSCSNAK